MNSDRVSGENEERAEACGGSAPAGSPKDAITHLYRITLIVYLPSLAGLRSDRKNQDLFAKQ